MSHKPMWWWGPLLQSGHISFRLEGVREICTLLASTSHHSVFRSGPHLSHTKMHQRTGYSQGQDRKSRGLVGSSISLWLHWMRAVGADPKPMRSSCLEVPWAGGWTQPGSECTFLIDSPFRGIVRAYVYQSAQPCASLRKLCLNQRGFPLCPPVGPEI